MGCKPTLVGSAIADTAICKVLPVGASRSLATTSFHVQAADSSAIATLLLRAVVCPGFPASRIAAIDRRESRFFVGVQTLKIVTGLLALFSADTAGQCHGTLGY
jgi:hypothetical protein